MESLDLPNSYQILPPLTGPYNPGNERVLRMATREFALRNGGPLMRELLGSLAPEVTEHPHFVVQSNHQPYQRERGIDKFRLVEMFHVDAALCLADWYDSSGSAIADIIEGARGTIFGVVAFGECAHTQVLSAPVVLGGLSRREPAEIGAIHRAVMEDVNAGKTSIINIPNGTPIQYGGKVPHRRGPLVNEGMRHVITWEVSQQAPQFRNGIEVFPRRPVDSL